MPTSPAEAITAFHRWFADAKPRLAAAVAAENLEPLVEEISGKVQALHEGLGWEIGPGVAGRRHAFALSAGGDLAARRVTELWRRAAADDGDWELHPAKPGGADLDARALDVEGEQVAFADVRVAADWDEDRERIDLRAFHPSFARVTPELAAQLVELALIETLGEDDCARWLGDREAVRAEPRDAGPIASLRPVIDTLARGATGERFRVLSGESDGQAVYALVNLACKPIDHLRFDVHLRIEIDVTDVTEAELPTKDELETLTAIEDDLRGELGEGALLIAQETGRKKRLLHFMTDDAKAVRAAVDEWRKVHGEDRAIAVKFRPDPQWDALARFG